MPDCIFCATPLDPNTKPEHVLLNALGGRKTTNQIICSSCNNTFGSGIDKTLADQLAIIRNLLQLESGTGSPPPTIRKVKAGLDTLDIRGDGTLDLLNKPFSYTEISPGNYNITINARSLEHANEIIPHIAAALRIPEDQLRRQFSVIDARFIERRPDTIDLALSFGGEDAIRSIAKACLVLWALGTGNKEVQGAPYEAARAFVKTGDADFVKSRTALDSRLHINVEKMKYAYGPLFNLIYVRSNDAGRVVGHFTLWNTLGFQIVLAESGGTPDHRIAVISNPLSPSDWSDDAASLFDIPFKWLDGPEYDETFHTQRERFSVVMQTYFDIFLPQTRHRIIDQVFEKYGLGEDEPIPQELIGKISDEIATRITHHALHLPFEERVDEQKLRAFLHKQLPVGKKR